MKILPIRRPSGSGGHEPGKRLADLLRLDCCDHKIITAISQAEGLNGGCTEQILDRHGWNTIPIPFRRSFPAVPGMYGPKIPLLLEQKKGMEAIPGAGKGCVIVGRSADGICIPVCTDPEAKRTGCMARAGPGDPLTAEQVRQNRKRSDRNRAGTGGRVKAVGGSRLLRSDRPHSRLGNPDSCTGCRRVCITPFWREP